MTQKLIRIGSRGSKLALWQAHWVQAQLESKGWQVEIETIKTTGDKILDVPLAKVGGKGLFVKEIEDALLEKRIDIAVHSMKDVPAALPEPLHLSAIPEREDPRDALLTRTGQGLSELPKNAVIGTSSLRRQAQLLALRPDLDIRSLRGNLDTRLRKLKEGDFDAILLAAAGLLRLGWGHEITESLSPETFLPAIAQGALGIECRIDDPTTNAAIAFLNHQPTVTAVAAERSLLATLEGGCQVPIAGYATISSGQVTLTALVASLDGQRIIREQSSAPVSDAVALGKRLAETLLSKGAKEILDEVYEAE